MKDLKQNDIGYYRSEHCNLTDFQEIINQTLEVDYVPMQD